MACPICDKPAAQTYKPFCSKRCADVDLAKWLSGSYAITASDPGDAEELADALEQLLDETAHDGSEKLH